MVRARIILAVVAGLLFCTLSTLELPEFLRLTDDTSNDFLVTQVHETAPTVVRKQTLRTQGVSIVTGVRRVDPHLARVPVCGWNPSTGDLLQLNRVLRV